MRLVRRDHVFDILLVSYTSLFFFHEGFSFVFHVPFRRSHPCEEVHAIFGYSSHARTQTNTRTHTHTHTDTTNATDGELVKSAQV